ncbi:hypothetical protein RND81_12G027200 [Saponaria officinalis]|uniref:Cystatin domain-containing protein n=1 Tax=Saponaria officinalis TaxID=3572 RepID=A0AAW1H546_SAPOF
MQKMTIFYFFLTIFIFTTTATRTNAERRKLVVGGRVEVKNVKTNKEIQELGKFSVEEYNKNILENPIQDVAGRAGLEGPLRFIEVVEAQKQVVSGLKYYLRVVAMQNNQNNIIINNKNNDDGLISKTFDAIVVVKPWVESKQLHYFGPSPK